MERLRRYFLLLSLILAGLTIFLVVRENRSAWKPFQEEYQGYLLETATTESDKVTAAQFSIKVQQDWLPTMKRADRCRSCHIGVDNPTAPAKPPLAAHPEIGPHPFSTFGCTVCHGGEGYATRLPDAHEQMVPSVALDSSCGKCHATDALTIDAPTYGAGSRLVARFNCAACHRFADRSRRESAGPDLNNLPTKVSRKWLLNWLQKPKQVLPAARMANFLLTREEAAALADYLLDATRPTAGTVGLIDSEAEQDSIDHMSEDDYDLLLEEGKILFGRLRCLSCHKLRNRGGDLGPELGRIAMKTNRAWISRWLAGPSAYDPETIMPTFTLDQRQRLSLVGYLLDESELDEEAGGEPMTGEATGEALEAVKAAAARSPQQRDAGARLFVERGCFNCHELAGVKGSPDFAPSLAAFADKKIEKIDFGTSNVRHNRADYVAAKLQRPRLFGKNLRMPDFGLNQEQVGRLATVVLAQTSAIPAELWKRPAMDKRDVLPAGEAGRLFKRYKCLSCHRINGVGGKLAPDLGAEGSKVKRQWLTHYLLKPYAIRPYLSERMPRFNMPESEAMVLAEYIDLVFRNKEIDALPLPRPGDAAIGKTLFFKKKTCLNCHALGKDGGYFGPALDVTGDRLQSAWINARLQNGHRFEPDSREPVMDLLEADRAALLAFLATLQKGAEAP